MKHLKGRLQSGQQSLPMGRTAKVTRQVRPVGPVNSDWKIATAIEARHHNYNVVLNVVSSLFGAIIDAIALSGRRPTTMN